MKRLTIEQERQVVDQWKRAGPELERIRREELRKWKYDWRVVDALLDMGARLKVSRPTSGLVEMQYWFRKLAEKQGLLPVRSAAKEEATRYEAGPRKARPRRTRRN